MPKWSIVIVFNRKRDTLRHRHGTDVTGRPNDQMCHTKILVMPPASQPAATTMIEFRARTQLRVYFAVQLRSAPSGAKVSCEHQPYGFV